MSASNIRLAYSCTEFAIPSISCYLTSNMKSATVTNIHLLANECEVLNKFHSSFAACAVHAAHCLGAHSDLSYVKILLTGLPTNFCSLICPS